MLDLLCPVCGGRLAREKTVWRCESRHSFDVARSGYVNLLPPSPAGKRHGDDKRMVAARTAHLPLAAESLDLIVNIFSPLMAEEFLRVLKPGGYLLRVVPMERHLFELKAAVYDRPYENPPAEPAVEGFRLLRTQTLRKTITLSSNEDVQALFLMTPYYYKTGAEDQQKLAAVPSLRVTTEFLIAVCQKP